MRNYNFYYVADAKHNPQRGPVWTGAYLDPAGQGRMISSVIPIYNGDFLEGVSGLDVTIESLVHEVINLSLPWSAAVFMVDQEGMILAMQKEAEIFGKLSMTDTLTGLFNRRKMDELLQQELRRAERYGQAFGIIICDIDHFKEVNAPTVTKSEMPF